MKHEVRQLKFVANDLDSGNICPACPTRDAKVYALHNILKHFPSLLFVRTGGGNHIPWMVYLVFLERNRQEKVIDHLYMVIFSSRISAE